MLPRQISWPVLNTFHSAVDLLPSFVGSVAPGNGSLRWNGSCFDGNRARLEFTRGDRGEPGLGGGVLYLEVRLPCLRDPGRVVNFVFWTVSRKILNLAYGRVRCPVAFLSADGDV